MYSPANTTEGGGGGGGTCPDTLRAVSKVQDGRPGVFGALEGGLHQSDEARVLGLLQAARQPLLHHRNELVFAELAVLCTHAHTEKQSKTATPTPSPPPPSWINTRPSPSRLPSSKNGPTRVSPFSSKMVKTTATTWSLRSTWATVLATCFSVAACNRIDQSRQRGKKKVFFYYRGRSRRRRCGRTSTPCPRR